MRRSISLRTYFSVVMCLMMILMSGILSITIGMKSSREFKFEIGDALAETAYQMADKMGAFMWSRSGEIYTLAQLEALHQFEDAQTMQRLLEQLKDHFPFFSWIGVTDRQGIVIAATQSVLSGADISRRPVFQEGLRGKFIGDVYDGVLLAGLLPNPSGEPMKFVDVSLPILDETGSPQGVLATHLSWEWAQEMADSVLRPLPGRNQMEMYILSAQDHTVLLGPPETIGTTLELAGIQGKLSSDNHWFEERWSDGKTYLTGYALDSGYLDYDGLGWTIVVRQPLTEAYSRVRRLQLYITLVGTACAFILSIIGWFVSDKIARPIRQIAAAAEYLKYDKGVQIPPYNGIKEVEQLYVSLRELLGSVVQCRTALDQMETVAYRDHLTGLLNRTGMEQGLELALQRAGKNDMALAFFYLDLDGFKAVNDTYGHHMGDLLLQEVGKRLKAIVRKGEIVARLGGDEFVVVLKSTGDQILEQNRMMARRMITELNQPFSLEGFTVYVGCSVGCAVWTTGMDPQAVLQQADEALYNAKRAGKNQAIFYDSEGNQEDQGNQASFS